MVVKLIAFMLLFHETSADLKKLRRNCTPSFTLYHWPLQQKTKMSNRTTQQTSTLADSIYRQQQFNEQNFNCPICLEPRLEMVHGLCQHRVCSRCLYNESAVLRPVMESCPLCQKPHSFPPTKPTQLITSIEIQRQLGVKSCPNAGCDVELWDWEAENHENDCPFSSNEPQPAKRSKAQAKCLHNNQCEKKNIPRKSTRLLTKVEPRSSKRLTRVTHKS